MTDATSTAAPTCAREYKVRVHPGQEEAYERYLREVVEPIDALAHTQHVFAHMYALRPEYPDAGWTHSRVFLFRDRAQRERFTQAMAASASQYDGSAAATERRKALAATLRDTVGNFDYTVSA